MQKGPLWWAGHHVNHHRFADRDGDPHSPMVSGVYYAHIGWFLNDTKHDRVETTAQSVGLEVVPRRSVEYGDQANEEMNVAAVITRAPELALIDELAHTNAPGMRNEKRYQDIDEVLVAGIDVISTVNVQHLESLNDAIFELTEVRVRETFPDRILDEADEVVLVDLSPEELRERLKAGKVYAKAQAELWTKGLADWGQDGARIQRLRDAADFAVYTPGSNAGIPVSILRSFADEDDAVSQSAVDALARLGPCEEHRRSFAPVRERLQSRLFDDATAMV